MHDPRRPTPMISPFGKGRVTAHPSQSETYLARGWKIDPEATAPKGKAKTAKEDKASA